MNSRGSTGAGLLGELTHLSSQASSRGADRSSEIQTLRQEAQSFPSPDSGGSGVGMEVRRMEMRLVGFTCWRGQKTLPEDWDSRAILPLDGPLLRPGV